MQELGAKSFTNTTPVGGALGGSPLFPKLTGKTVSSCKGELVVNLSPLLHPGGLQGNLSFMYLGSEWKGKIL